MNTQMIDGKCYARMLLGGAAMLAQHRDELNALNVFPVADGDTGTNMLMTIEGGLAEANEASEASIGEASRIFARGILLSARGNSGVILSQIFAGINDGLAEYDSVNAVQLADAYGNGIVKSYAAVQNPTEGTILTVFRESTEYAKANLTEASTVEDFFKLHIEQARKSLAATKNLLHVLAEADVVDSGAAGYLYIAEGMYKALGGEALEYEVAVHREKNSIDIDAFTRDSVLEYGYCTEVLLRLTSAKVDPDNFDINTVLGVLEELHGESVVAYKEGDIVKVHVHTFTPGEVIASLQQFGEFLTVKVENMSLGHSEAEAAGTKKKKKFAVVAVATGEGISALFSQMGVHRIIAGGQSANPAIEDFIDAFKSCDAENIIVLPNNKNIILAAKGAAELYTDANVYVLETKSLPQGYSALSVITPGLTDMGALVNSANRAARDVIDAEITMAIRDANIDGTSIKCGDYIAIRAGSIAAVADDAEGAVLKMLENTDMDLAEIITLFVGKGVSEEKRARLTEHLKEIYDECEIVVYEGGQDVYDYLVAVE